MNESLFAMNNKNEKTPVTRTTVRHHYGEKWRFKL